MDPQKPTARDRFGRENRLTREAWDQRYRDKETGWDIGSPAPPLARWFAANPPKGNSVLVPGCGRGHEARHLVSLGAETVVAVDISALALEEARQREPALSAKVLWTQADVRKLSPDVSGPFDRVVEHTCFCALSPDDRLLYLEEVKRILKPDGLLVGLFYVDFENSDGPPFGIFQKDLRPLLESRFEIITWESHPEDSAPVRKNKEVLVVARRV